jgi:hypothetical protein
MATPEDTAVEAVVTTPGTATGPRCAWCEGPLPAPIETLPFVCATDGTTLTTCGTACLAALVADLAGAPAEPPQGSPRRD